MAASFISVCLGLSLDPENASVPLFLDGVTPMGQIWKPEERPPKIRPPLRGLGFRRLLRGSEGTDTPD